MSATQRLNFTAPSRKCPLCTLDGSTDLGEILHPTPLTIAGIPLDLGDTEFRLFRCKSCGFSYKLPRIPENRLLDCYARADIKTWGLGECSPDRRFDQISALVTTHAPGRRVLDIGCFTGDLLAFMGSKWERFGVEPNTRAAVQAAANGIGILGATVADLPDDIPGFDAILAIDVVEHLLDPLSFFRDVSRALRPNGILVVLTGNTDAWSWRLLGNRYWYCNIPEHVSFYCKECFDYIAHRFGLIEIEHMRMSHNRWGLRDRALQAAKNLGYVVMNRAGGFGSASLRRLFVERRAPVWITARDHTLCVMKKSARSLAS